MGILALFPLLQQQHLTEVAMAGGEVGAEKQPLSVYLSPGRSCDLGIVEPNCCVSLQGVCVSSPALSA